MFVAKPFLEGSFISEEMSSNSFFFEEIRKSICALFRVVGCGLRILGEMDCIGLVQAVHFSNWEFDLPVCRLCILAKLNGSNYGIRCGFYNRQTLGSPWSTARERG